MADNNPFLYVHLPLDEVRDGLLLDVSHNRRHAVAHAAKIVGDDATFGRCLELAGTSGSYLEFPPWKLNPAIFLPPSANRSPAEDPLKLTYSVWISPAARDGEWTLIDSGFRPDLQRLKVRFKRQNQALTFTVLAPADRERTRGLCWRSQATMPAGPWMHFAMVWDPNGEGADAGYGSCQMYLNGGFFSSSGKTIGEAPARLPGGAASQTFVGWPAFAGRLAHFRIHTRELMQQEIVQQIDTDLEGLRRMSPVECSLLDPLGNPRMYLDFSDVGEKMQVVVKPLQTGLKLAGLPPGPPAPDRCHFELGFRPGTLELTGNPAITANTEDGPGRWEAVAYPRIYPGGGDVVCIQSLFERPFDRELRIVLSFLKADRRFPPRWTRVDLRYRNLQDGQGKALRGRMPQWLQLEPRTTKSDLPLADLRAGQGWTPDAETNLGLRGGNTFFQGQLFCADAQEQMKRDNWQLVTSIPADYAPSGERETRFPGRVRWLATAGSPGPGTLWCSDLIIAPIGAVSLAVDLPTAMLRDVGQIAVLLDGMSYPNEKLWVVS